MTRAFLAVLAAAMPLASHAARPVVELQCLSFGQGPRLECTVRIHGADGKPLSGAAVTLSAMMPSMPMAHSVKPEPATATATPGEYRGQVVLEMVGAWAVQVDITAPVRERVARTLLIDKCDGDRRCPAKPLAAASAATPSSKH